VRYQNWILDSFGPGLSGRVIEVGAGNGNLTRFLARRCESLVALEPNQGLCDQLHALALPDVRVVNASLDDFPPGEERFDSALMVNVLEHIEEDLKALEKVRELLRPGGRLNLLVPAHPSLYSPLDRRFGHHRRYTKRRLAEVMAAAGYEVGLARYFNPIGALGWFFLLKVPRRQRLSSTSVVLTERVAVPIGKWLERRGDPLFGQSLIAVGLRP
jgi:SAM-dependent methyltransferase